MPDMYLMHPGHPLPLAVVWRHHLKRTPLLRIPRYLHPRKEPTMSTESVTPMSETAYGRKIASGAYFNGAFQSPKVSLDKITRDVQVERGGANVQTRSEEHTSELQSLMRISYAVFCLKKKKNKSKTPTTTQT